MMIELCEALLVDRSAAEQLLGPTCLQVIHDPVQDGCRNFFCRPCIEHWLKVQPRCPVSRLPVFPKLFKKSRSTLNRIKKLKTFCEERKNGCIWQDCVSKPAAHKKTLPVCEDPIRKVQLYPLEERS